MFLHVIVLFGMSFYALCEIKHCFNNFPAIAGCLASMLLFNRERERERENTTYLLKQYLLDIMG